MTIEKQLKELILDRYDTIYIFSQEINLPASTISTIFKRGVLNANLKSIIKICKHLGISADALADGEIKPR